MSVANRMQLCCSGYCDRCAQVSTCRRDIIFMSLSTQGNMYKNVTKATLVSLCKRQSISKQVLTKSQFKNHFQTNTYEITPGVPNIMAHFLLRIGFFNVTNNLDLLFTKSVSYALVLLMLSFTFPVFNILRYPR